MYTCMGKTRTFHFGWLMCTAHAAAAKECGAHVSLDRYYDNQKEIYQLGRLECAMSYGDLRPNTPPESERRACNRRVCLMGARQKLISYDQNDFLESLTNRESGTSQPRSMGIIPSTRRRIANGRIGFCNRTYTRTRVQTNGVGKKRGTFT